MTTTILCPASVDYQQIMLELRGECVVRDITFDGNRDARGWPGGFDWQQSHCINARDGSFTVERVHFARSPGDGICISRNATASISNITASDVFRGVVVMNGGNSSAVVSNVDAGDGQLIDMEMATDNDGDGPTPRRMDLEMTDCDMSRLHVEGHPDSTVEIERCSVTAGMSFVCYDIGYDGETPVLDFTDCDIHMVSSGQLNRLYWPVGLTFTNVRFTGEPVQLYPFVNDVQRENGSVVFNGCSFIGSGDAAVYNYGSPDNDHGNSVTFIDCTYQGFSTGYTLHPGRFSDDDTSGLAAA